MAMTGDPWPGAQFPQWWQPQFDYNTTPAPVTYENIKRLMDKMWQRAANPAWPGDGAWIGIVGAPFTPQEDSSMKEFRVLVLSGEKDKPKTTILDQKVWAKSQGEAIIRAGKALPDIVPDLIEVFCDQINHTKV